MTEGLAQLGSFIANFSSPDKRLNQPRQAVIFYVTSSVSRWPIMDS
jgi:hypothetical protein